MPKKQSKTTKSKPTKSKPTKSKPTTSRKTSKKTSRKTSRKTSQKDTQKGSKKWVTDCTHLLEEIIVLAIKNFPDLSSDEQLRVAMIHTIDQTKHRRCRLILGDLMCSQDPGAQKFRQNYIRLINEYKRTHTY